MIICVVMLNIFVEVLHNFSHLSPGILQLFGYFDNVPNEFILSAALPIGEVFPHIHFSFE